MRDDLEKISRQLDALDKDDIKTIVKRGDLLEEAKKLLCTHGGWLQWLKTRHSMPDRTAQRYMKASRFAKNATVAHLSLTPSALYLLSEDAFWKKVGAGDNSRRTATEEVLKAASKDKVGEQAARDIIKKALGIPKLTEEAEPPDNLLLHEYDEVVTRLKKLFEKPTKTFARTIHASDDLDLEAFADQSAAHFRDVAWEAARATKQTKDTAA